MQVFDSHVDTPSQLIRLRDLGIDNKYGHVDFPKLQRGGVGGAFFALYTPPETAPDAATRYALEMISAVYDAVDANPDLAALAFSPEESSSPFRCCAPSTAWASVILRSRITGTTPSPTALPKGSVGTV